VLETGLAGGRDLREQRIGAVAGTHDRGWGHTCSFDLRVDRGWVWSGRNVLQTALGGRVLREQCIGCAV
jgi:hypothetical protein